MKEVNDVFIDFNEKTIDKMRYINKKIAFSNKICYNVIDRKLN